MPDEEFDWDDRKAASNSRKHHVSFEQAREAFDDPNALGSRKMTQMKTAGVSPA